MRLIFIRHADPDYSVDSLTEKGWREATYLAERAAKWPVDAIYVSPLGRARDTAKLTQDALGMDATICPWMEEFTVMIPHPVTGRPSIPWDFMPSDWTHDTELLDALHWAEAERYQRGLAHGPRPTPEQIASNTIPYEKKIVLQQANWVAEGIDQVLTQWGYQREGLYYRTDETRDVTLVFFAHLGVIDVMLSHVLNISAPSLWHSMYLAPSSVTVLGAEEREPGIAYFRAQSYGDTAHLFAHNEPVSTSGYFTNTFSL